MTYFDTAYITKCYLNEAGAERVQEFALDAGPLCSCELARIEFHCAVQRYLREEKITASLAKEVLAQFHEDEATGVWHWFPVSVALLDDVCESVSRLPRKVFIRAADALHLGCARRNGLRAIYTNDRHMLAAARHFGLEGIDVIEP